MVEIATPAPHAHAQAPRILVPSEDDSEPAAQTPASADAEVAERILFERTESVAAEAGAFRTPIPAPIGIPPHEAPALLPTPHTRALADLETMRSDNQRLKSDLERSLRDQSAVELKMKLLKESLAKAAGEARRDVLRVLADCDRLTEETAAKDAELQSLQAKIGSLEEELQAAVESARAAEEAEAAAAAAAAATPPSGAPAPLAVPTEEQYVQTTPRGPLVTPRAPVELQSTLKDLQARHECAAAALHAKLAFIAALSERLSEMHAALGSEKERSEDLETEAELLRDKVTLLERQRGEAEARAAKLMRQAREDAPRMYQIVDLHRQCIALQERCTDLEVENRRLRESNAHTNARNTGPRGHGASLPDSARVRSLEEENAGLKAALRQLQRRLGVQDESEREPASPGSEDAVSQSSSYVRRAAAAASPASPASSLSLSLRPGDRYNEQSTAQPAARATRRPVPIVPPHAADTFDEAPSPASQAALLTPIAPAQRRVGDLARAAFQRSQQHRKLSPSPTPPPAQYTPSDGNSAYDPSPRAHPRGGAALPSPSPLAPSPFAPPPSPLPYRSTEEFGVAAIRRREQEKSSAENRRRPRAQGRRSEKGMGQKVAGAIAGAVGFTALLGLGLLRGAGAGRN